jgi:hypothetical protein
MRGSPKLGAMRMAMRRSVSVDSEVLGSRPRHRALGHRAPGNCAQRKTCGNDGRYDRTDEGLEHPIPGRGSPNVAGPGDTAME